MNLLRRVLGAVLATILKLLGAPAKRASIPRPKSPTTTETPPSDSTSTSSQKSGTVPREPVEKLFLQAVATVELMEALEKMGIEYPQREKTLHMIYAIGLQDVLEGTDKLKEVLDKYSGEAGDLMDILKKDKGEPPDVPPTPDGVLH